MLLWVTQGSEAQVPEEAFVDNDAPSGHVARGPIASAAIIDSAFTDAGDGDAAPADADGGAVHDAGGGPDSAVVSPSPRSPGLAARRRAVFRTMRAKGIIVGDSAALDQALHELEQARRSNDAQRGARAAEQANEALDALRVDKAFVQTKLLRFNRAYDAARAGQASAEVRALAKEGAAAYRDGRNQRANALLNQAFQRLAGR
jgi:hypothetical protein